MFGKIDVELAVQVGMLAAALLAAFILHEAARKIALANRKNTILHNGGEQLMGALLGASNIILWAIVSVGACVLVIKFMHAVQADPKSLFFSILFGLFLSVIASGSGALLGYYDDR